MDNAPVSEPEPESIQFQDGVAEQVLAFYEMRISDEMEALHNRIVAYISEAQIPLTHVLMVLEILKQETLEQAMKKYLGS